jgi:hypothetical protein
MEFLPGSSLQEAAGLGTSSDSGRVSNESESVSYSFQLPHLNLAGELITLAPPPANHELWPACAGRPAGAARGPAGARVRTVCQWV